MRLSPRATGDFHSLDVLAVTETSKSNALVEAGRGDKDSPSLGDRSWCRSNAH